MDDPAKEPLTYEETPILEPISDTSVPEMLTTPKAEEKDLPDPLARPEISEHSNHGRSKAMPIITDIVIFSVLFALGVIGSMFLRPYISGSKETGSQNPRTTPSPVIIQTVTPNAIQETAMWNTYTEASGFSYSLPKDVLAPICDGSTCASKGTYLPGATRFTVSTKNTPQPVSNFSNLIVTDASGVQFETTNTVVSGYPAVSYTGLLNGTTTGGYAFTRIRGVMIMLSESTMVEFNHFAPKGVTSDFDADEKVFSDILNRLTTTLKQSPTPLPAMVK